MSLKWLLYTSMLDVPGHGEMGKEAERPERASEGRSEGACCGANH